MRAALLVVAVLLGACAHAPPSEAKRAPSPTDYFPLAIGNSWTYLDRSPQLGGDLPARRVVRIVSRDAEGYFHDNERGELRADADCLHDRLRRLLCAPFEVGKSWLSVVSVTSTEHFEIAAVGAEVQTPAGRFSGCVKVRARNRAAKDVEQVLEMTYAPGVGPVRLETFVVAKGEARPLVRAELEAYRLEKR